MKALTCDSAVQFDSLVVALTELKNMTKSKSDFLVMLSELPKVAVANALGEIGKKSGYRKHQVSKNLILPKFATMSADLKQLVSSAEMIVECPGLCAKLISPWCRFDFTLVQI
jgi:hypothetical protein